MINIIVTDENGVIVSKDVYSGDDQTSLQLINDLSIKNPSLTYHQEVDQAIFDSSQIISTEKTEWQAAKAQGTNAALSYLGKKFGLE